MLSTTLVLVAALAASASAAPAAKTVKCEQIQLPIDFGLSMQLVNSASHPPSGSKDQPKLPKGGVTLDIPGANNGTPLSFATDTGIDFGFESCNSTYVGWKTTKAHDNTETHYFGHLGITDNEGVGLGDCLTIAVGKKGEQLVLGEKCATADNKSQLSQWWTAVVPKDRNRPTIVRFLGQRESTYNDQQYHDLHPSKRGNTTFVASTFHSSGGFKSHYDLSFSDTIA